jgi:hypothetical protein
LAFLSKTNVKIKILHNLALFCVKNAIFCAEFFGENILKIITSVQVEMSKFLTPVFGQQKIGQISLQATLIYDWYLGIAIRLMRVTGQGCQIAYLQTEPQFWYIFEVLGMEIFGLPMLWPFGIF